MSRTEMTHNAIDVQVCSVQNGLVRFPFDEDHIRQAPPVARYRNNLTALSQKYNLLFIAASEAIWVYEPGYPNQTVPQISSLVFGLHRTADGRLGYIDRSTPHAVNHLIVGDLGNEEILLVACDDGDVMGFHVHRIKKRLEETFGFECESIPFFIENVGLSAWGLAIHKEARLIAVSANTHEITVFAFALGHGSSSGSDDDSMDDIAFIETLQENSRWNSIDIPYDPKQRSSRNLIVRLKHHVTNIPSIAFCNGAADPHGQYLVSTDISGATYVWDVWRQRPVARKALGDMTPRNTPSGRVDAEYRGWGVACLDPQFFRAAEDKDAFFGCSMRRIVETESDRVWNISACIETIPDASVIHPGMVGLGSVPGMDDYIFRQRERDEDDQSDTNEQSGSSSEDSEGEDDEDSTEDGEHLIEMGSSPSIGPADRWYNMLDPGRLNFDEYVLGLDAIEENARGRMIAITGSNPENGPVLGDAENIQDEVVGPGNVLVNEDNDGFPFPLLYTNEFDIALFDKRKHGSVRVICQDALHQNFPPRLHHLINFDRLNMIHQIPSLGIVAIASQAGRVALLSLTKLDRHHAQTRPLYGYRIEHILPFKSQEERGERPEMPLLGMAIGPVQGGGSDEMAGMSGRYRLLLIYYDHTVMSYEFGRDKGGSGYEVNDRVLVV